ncbi:hypothetical protein Tco_0088333 [Tanacetum coccineum]
MKLILQQWMFENGSYKSHLNHASVYQALEVSIDCDNMEEFFEDKVKSRKRCHDDQDPSLLPLKDYDRSKKKRHDSDASRLKQPQGQQSSAWKSSNTREAPSSSSKLKSTSHSEQLIEDVLIPDDTHILDSKDIDAAHLPKIRTRPNWLKPIPEEEMHASPKLDWIIPPNGMPEAENN